MTHDFFYQELMNREKRKREFSSIETSKDDDAKNEEGSDRKLPIQGELSVKRRRVSSDPPEETWPTYQGVSVSSVY